MARRTFDQVRAEARAERDIEIATFMDGYAELIRGDRDDPCGREVATMAAGLASSLRAGLIE